MEKHTKTPEVSRVEPDGIILKTKSGISKVYFTELPKDVQQRFGYDVDKARQYEAEQNKVLEESQKQQAEEMRQSEQETQKKNNESRKGEEAFQQWKNGQSLQDTLMVLRQQKASLERTIQERESLPASLRSDRTRSGGSHHWYPNPARADLPDLRRRLGEVKGAIIQTEKQLRQAQQAGH